METLLPQNVINILHSICEIVNKPFISTGTLKISIMTLILLLPIIIFSFSLGKFAGKMVQASIKKKKNINEIHRFRLVKLVSYGVSFMSLFVGLSALGINLSALGVILGALGIGVGFGLQTLISNFSAGLVIFFTGPVKEGDRVTVDNVEGDVTKINTISTIITTLMDETLIVPNSLLISNSCFNHTYNGRFICIENSIRIGYEADVDKAMHIMKETIEKSPYNQEGAEASVRLSDFNDMGILLVSYINISDVKKRGPAKSWNNVAIYHAFKENGIPLLSKKLEIRNII